MNIKHDTKAFNSLKIQLIKNNKPNFKNITKTARRKLESDNTSYIERKTIGITDAGILFSRSFTS